MRQDGAHSCSAGALNSNQKLTEFHACGGASRRLPPRSLEVDYLYNVNVFVGTLPPFPPRRNRPKTKARSCNHHHMQSFDVTS